MPKVLALVEGLTEETFVRQVLEPYLLAYGVSVISVILTTKRLASGAKVRGGVSVWSKIERELRTLLGDSSCSCVTTFLDYHAFPVDAPGMDTRPAGDPYERISHVERALAERIGDERFLPYLSLHEFEALVLASPEAIGQLSGNNQVQSQLAQIVSSRGGPEKVNEGYPPSRHIMDHWPLYQKSIHGPLVTSESGIERLTDLCPHLRSWIHFLRGLS